MVDNLFETVGGRGTISSAVDSFYRRVLADESVQHFFRNVDMEHLRARQSMFVSMLLGERVVYTGQASLDGVGVKPDNVEKIMVLLEGTRKVVLNC
jgi:hemoglobin